MISARIKELRPAGLDEAYLEGTELYEALMCGAPLTESQRRALLPARADTVALYRAVGAAATACRRATCAAVCQAGRAGRR